MKLNLLTILLIAAGCTPAWSTRANAEGEPWEVLTNCILIPNEYNDGDSFHVKTSNGSEKVFRLYMVDAPETSNEFPERVGEQAAHFKCSPERAIEGGKEATTATAEFLKNGFTVKTKGEDAMGRSAGGRTYAIVELPNGDDLGATLLKLGMARAHGRDPNNQSSAKEKAEARKLKIPTQAQYEQLENRARATRAGVWSKKQE